MVHTSEDYHTLKHTINMSDGRAVRQATTNRVPPFSKKLLKRCDNISPESIVTLTGGSVLQSNGNILRQQPRGGGCWEMLTVADGGRGV